MPTSPCGPRPAAYDPGAGNQKGSVENLVKFVQHTFLRGRSFRDDTQLAEGVTGWLERVNVERTSDATQHTPAALLPDEQAAFGPLPVVTHDYGCFDTVKVPRESLVTIAATQYSAPVARVEQLRTVRISPTRIARSARDTRVATHVRQFGRHQRMVIPEHYEPVFARKPRAQVMVYHDGLVQLSPQAANDVR